MTVHNPSWLQVFFYIGIAGFPCLSAYFYYMAFEAILQQNLVGICLMLLLGIGISYISYIGITLAKYVSAKVVYDENQFSVHIGDSVNNYAWTDIASAKNYESSQILKIFDKNGKTIYVVDHLTPGYSGFAEKVGDNVGI